MQTVADIMSDYISKQDTIINTKSIIIENGPQELLFKLNDRFYLDYPIDLAFNLNNNLNNYIHKDVLIHDLTTFLGFLVDLSTHESYDTTINLVKHQYKTVLNIIDSNITNLNIKKIKLLPSLVTLKTKVDSITTIVEQLDTLLTQIEDYIYNGG